MIRILCRSTRISFFFIHALFLLKTKNGYKKLPLIIQKMGPAFIKLGQAISTRSDLIGTDLAYHLTKLCDSTTPYKFSKIKKSLEKELKSTIESKFKYFEKDPIASASIAQVHKATLHNNKKVAVKILHPKIEKKFCLDLKIMHLMARILNPLVKKRFNLLKIIERFKNASQFELNLEIEAANASEMKDLLQQNTETIIPAVFWEYSTKRVLITEWIDGLPLTKINKISDKIIEKLILLFFSQIYDHGFFHGDFHMGNIIITTHSEKIALVDFGIMGRLSIKDRIYLAKITKGFFDRNYQYIVDVHYEADYISENNPFFVSMCRSIGEPMFNKKLKEISIARLLGQIFYTANNFKIEIQPQLLLLQKNIMMLEGISKKFSPESNMWKILKPMTKTWLKKNLLIKYRNLKINDTTKKVNKTLENLNNFLRVNSHPKSNYVQKIAIFNIILTLFIASGIMLLYLNSVNKCL
ncbi:ubiquinone biosynthesis protein [Anaplasmataceae bacterium AB001_6]|nr:ubiquinone biosynthesis protein [Anaplasmataceae bacterium AB001_6]